MSFWLLLPFEIDGNNGIQQSNLALLNTSLGISQTLFQSREHEIRNHIRENQQ